MGARILVVDDHLEMAEMLAESLAEAGFEAEALASGGAALERLDGGFPPPLVHLPDRRGPKRVAVHRPKSTRPRA